MSEVDFYVKLMDELVTQEKKDKKMATNDKTDTLPYTVEMARNYCYYDHYETYEAAEQAAREKAWESGRDHFVMVPKAVVRPPEQVNTSKVEAL